MVIITKKFSNNKSPFSKNNNGNVVAADKTILILLLEVRNLKNIIKLTITITVIISIVKIMKALTRMKVVLIIRLVTPHRPPLPNLKKNCFHT